MWGQPSPGQEFTQRQNNGQHTYNRAPHLIPDRIRDPLLHRHGLPEGAETEHGRPPYAIGTRGFRGNNIIVDLLSLIGALATIPVALATAYQTGLFFNTQYGWSDLHSWAIMVAAVVFWPWLCRWVYVRGRNLQQRGGFWFVPIKLAALAAAFGVTAYFFSLWTWGVIDLLELAIAAQDRLYCGVGVGLFFGLAVYTTLTQTR